MVEDHLVIWKATVCSRYMWPGIDKTNKFEHIYMFTDKIRCYSTQELGFNNVLMKLYVTEMELTPTILK
jgi:hypothetical protein